MSHGLVLYPKAEPGTEDGAFSFAARYFLNTRH